MNQSWEQQCLRLHMSIVLCLLFLSPSIAHGLKAPEEFWLITPEEAAMAPHPDEVTERGLFGREPGFPDNGPEIEVSKPSMGNVNPSPVEILIRFIPRSAAVDLSTLKVTLVKIFNIDLTERILPYLSPDGIHVQEAPLPSGVHTVRVSLGDQNGGLTTKQIRVEVE